MDKSAHDAPQATPLSQEQSPPSGQGQTPAKPSNRKIQASPPTPSSSPASSRVPYITIPQQLIHLQSTIKHMDEDMTDLSVGMANVRSFAHQQAEDTNDRLEQFQAQLDRMEENLELLSGALTSMGLMNEST